ncbi:MAG: DUF3006 domain-containing protein [Armatimonadetes bacterium]|nr:DUF3006 domain-containing protein [Armatimonadota bacterium]MBI2247526.1 DUF3006 domain-containing protein [Armatimonadota bacterium]MBI2973087.1 DUF3006 domain-containing protein [Armatimonadota bacterium]
MRAIIDRVEDGVAVLVFESGGRAYVPADQLPPGAGEGTVLQIGFHVDTDANASEIAALIDRLRRRTEEHLD